MATVKIRRLTAKATPPTAAQAGWLKQNKQYRRTSHAMAGKFRATGTLLPDGTFLPATPQRPVTDGAGSFGVGVPVAPRRGKRR